MTKIKDSVLLITMIIFCAGFIIASIYLQSRTEKALESYAIRKEELASKQQQIQDMLAQFNDTLQKEIEQSRATLNSTVINDKNTTQNSSASSVKNESNLSPIVIMDPVPPVVNPKPAPIRRTRAS